MVSWQSIEILGEQKKRLTLTLGFGIQTQNNALKLFSQWDRDESVFHHGPSESHSVYT